MPPALHRASCTPGASPSTSPAEAGTRTTSCPPDCPSAHPKTPWTAPAASTSATSRPHQHPSTNCCGAALELAAACPQASAPDCSIATGGKATVRDVDPDRLVHTGRWWYFVARDVTRDQWRTFRADRVDRLPPTGHPVELLDPPDLALLVSRSVATGSYPLYATIRLLVSMGQALQLIPSAVGAHRPESPDAAIVDIGGADADGLARPPQPGRTPASPVTGGRTASPAAPYPGTPRGERERSVTVAPRTNVLVPRRRRHRQNHPVAHPGGRTRQRRQSTRTVGRALLAGPT
ncbi:helix-turn-helix transcriptional regulator [Streptomyces sp. NPDC088252]|uniref:helix-turn-helix transcriptional regulator n=1 Tax=Streptomyces sp. NPDC088252 TaxID=3365845 RepID=UPI00381D46A9